MKIKVSEILIGYNGQPLKDTEDQPVTIKGAIVLALNNQLQNEILTAEDKAKIYQLSVKIFSSDEIDLTVDDRAFIKERAGKILSPLMYGRLGELLEGKEDNSKSES